MPVRLAITPGEPAGVGPELLIRLAESAREIPWVAVADAHLLAERARALGSPVRFDHDLDHPSMEAGRLTVRHVPLQAPCVPGQLDPRNAAYVLETLRLATDGCLAGEFSGLVTGPVQKSVMNDAGIAFTGHTEFLCERAGVADVLMLLVAGTLRVGLATTHLPLRAVPEALSRTLLDRRLGLLLRGLRRDFGVARPRVLVAGLNPHAGEGGHLGTEEVEIIDPVCEGYRAAGELVRGPLPADTLFTPAMLDTADAVLAMYHDQGLPVLKHAGFGRAVNVTLGLPFVRTSVDHGTALDLAGSGVADPGSFAAAAALAGDLLEIRASA
ncbi:MAG: 4-hydroxythreonine-4-phosphate dehydrogenase PdxA [Gammaproteobacteria bacterium]|nr:MAG: 4-hydroxythreonine-4-phosphate dehydrogenase PdxA [Gammaproteobacteria bacterium]